MLLPIEWLQQFVPVNETAEQVAERFILLGFECEVEGDVIDLEITPNRGDVLSILGLAREYAASTEQTLTLPEFHKLEHVEQLPGIAIEADPAAYHALSAIVVENVSVGPSPDWMQRRLVQAGMNSINNLVDLTNYVMLELGIPLHAFDLDAITGPTMNIRLSQEGEQFLSLKDESVKLPTGSIIVENDGQIIDLLGIRGGKSSMITQNTKRTLIWAASVPRPLIRHTSKLLNLRTDGSYRHERETDWDMVPRAIERIAALTRETTGGNISGQITRNAEIREPKSITFSAEKISDILGLPVDHTTAQKALERLGFSVSGSTATVPSWRYFDINFPEDLTEEVARMIGYNNLPRTVITSQSASHDTEYGKAETIKDQLIEQGWTEVYTESFTGKADLAGLPVTSEKLAVLANPVNRDFANCRPSLIPNLIKILVLNNWADEAQIFELGHIFPTHDREENYIALAATGKKAGLLKSLVSPDKIQLITPEHPLARQYKLRRPITIVEIPVSEWPVITQGSFIVPQGKPAYRQVSPFPPAVRDLSIIIDTSVTPEQVINTIQAVDPDKIFMVELFDQFQSDKFGTNKQSLAFHIIYQSPDATLDNEIVDTLQKKTEQVLVESYNATIR